MTTFALDPSVGFIVDCVLKYSIFFFFDNLLKYSIHHPNILFFLYTTILNNSFNWVKRINPSFCTRSSLIRKVIDRRMCANGKGLMGRTNESCNSFNSLDIRLWTEFSNIYVCMFI